MFGLGPDPALVPYLYGLAVVITAIAAFTDWKTGHIPNWLTLPPLVFGPIVFVRGLGAVGFYYPESVFNTLRPHAKALMAPDAADTLANDAAILGVRLTRVS